MSIIVSFGVPIGGPLFGIGRMSQEFTAEKVQLRPGCVTFPAPGGLYEFRQDARGTWLVGGSRYLEVKISPVAGQPDFALAFVEPQSTEEPRYDAPVRTPFLRFSGGEVFAGPILVATVDEPDQSFATPAWDRRFGAIDIA